MFTSNAIYSTSLTVSLIPWVEMKMNSLSSSSFFRCFYLIFTLLSLSATPPPTTYKFTFYSFTICCCCCECRINRNTTKHSFDSCHSNWATFFLAKKYSKVSWFHRVLSNFVYLIFRTIPKISFLPASSVCSRRTFRNFKWKCCLLWRREEEKSSNRMRLTTK